MNSTFRTLVGATLVTCVVTAPVGASSPGPMPAYRVHAADLSPVQASADDSSAVNQDGETAVIVPADVDNDAGEVRLYRVSHE